MNTPMNATHRLQIFRDAPQVDIATLLDWFDSLPPVAESFMLGAWQGGCFNTGHPGEAMLTKMQWRGKRFNSRTNVAPMICSNAAGEPEVNPVLGAAQLREMVYRGIPTATMVYDNQPIFDHFRYIDDNTVLGIMDRKDDETPLFFFLQRI